MSRAECVEVVWTYGENIGVLATNGMGGQYEESQVKGVWSNEG